MYLHVKSIEPPQAHEVLERVPTKALIYKRIPFKYRTHFQRLMLGTELLEEDVDCKEW